MPEINDESNGAGRTTAKRIGFWLGLVLFVGILVMPTPESMRRTVRAQFGEAIKVDVERVLENSGAGSARGDSVSVPHPSPGGRRMGHPAPKPAARNGVESAAYRQVEARAVEQRARVMLAAAAVTALVACWWITVAVPIPVTSLLPLVLFPFVGVMSIKQAAAPYANPNVFLFMGGFIIALAIERWGLHRRIALHIVLVVGTGRATIVLGFMVASAVLSMWISNTATTLMMVPIGLAIITAVGQLEEGSKPAGQKNFAAALMLGIAYGASVGGVATPIGTPPNISFRGIFARLYPEAPEISFGQWMIVFIPFVVVFLPVVWLVLVRVTCRVGRGRTAVGREVIRDELRGLGRMERPERSVLAVFVLTALLWMTRTIPLGDANYGWSALIEGGLAAMGGGTSIFNAGYINDATVALGMAVLLFVIPASGRSRNSAKVSTKPGAGQSTAATEGGRYDSQRTVVGNVSGRREFLMNWATAERLPWGILLLFGGGFSIAAGLSTSGLSSWCGEVFAGIGLTHPLWVVVATCLMMTFLTEVTSNTATTEVMLPILAGVSHSMGVSPLMLMLPATISASCAFMMPVATPPNAIVFGSGHVEMGRMVRSGLIINFVGVVLVTATFYLVACPVLGIDPTITPGWAE